MPGARPDALHTRDPAQLTVHDGERPSRDHLTLDHSIPQLFLVAITLVVAIEESRHRSVAPVDDLHAAAAFHEAALADEHIATAITLAQAQVSEIGGLAIDRRALALATLA